MKLLLISAETRYHKVGIKKLNDALCKTFPPSICIRTPNSNLFLIFINFYLKKGNKNAINESQVNDEEAIRASEWLGDWLRRELA